MAVVDLTPVELGDLIKSLRARYRTLAEPRRWYTALVCAALVRAQMLPEWSDWQLEPPSGLPIQMTPSAMRAIDEIFGVSAGALMRDIPGGAVSHIGHPKRIIFDPLQRTGNDVCVVVEGKWGYFIPLTDPSWLWNPETNDLPADGYPQPSEYKRANDYGQQQGIACAFPALELFAAGADAASALLDVPRQQCQYFAIKPKKARARAGVDDAPVTDQPVCTLNGNGCASKGAGVVGPGGPRCLIPDHGGANVKTVLLAPGSIDRMLQDANPNGEQLPSGHEFALMMDYLHKGYGSALDANRFRSVLASAHTSVLFEN